MSNSDVLSWWWAHIVLEWTLRVVRVCGGLKHAYDYIYMNPQGVWPYDHRGNRVNKEYLRIHTSLFYYRHCTCLLSDTPYWDNTQIQRNVFFFFFLGGVLPLPPSVLFLSFCMTLGHLYSLGCWQKSKFNSPHHRKNTQCEGSAAEQKTKPFPAMTWLTEMTHKSPKVGLSRL